MVIWGSSHSSQFPEWVISSHSPHRHWGVSSLGPASGKAERLTLIILEMPWAGKDEVQKHHPRLSRGILEWREKTTVGTQEKPGLEAGGPPRGWGLVGLRTGGWRCGVCQALSGKGKATGRVDSKRGEVTIARSDRDNVILPRPFYCPAA